MARKELAKYNAASLFISPTLVLGLGGAGTEVLRLVKARVRRAMVKMPEIVDFLALDTEPCTNPPGQERIFEREFGYLGDYNAAEVLDNLQKFPHIQDWWPSGDAQVTGVIHKGARQRRIVGRLSLYVRWGEVATPLDSKLDRIREIHNKESLQRRGVEVERATGQVQVYIVGSLCGGTGSGIFLDVAFRVRKKLGDDADIVGVFLLPSCFTTLVHSRVQRQRIQANTCASLLELNHFMSGAELNACFPDQPFYDGQGQKNVAKLRRPFDSVYLVDRSNGKEFLASLDEVQRMAAQQLFLDLVTPIGKRYAARRANLRDLAGERAASSSTESGLVLPPLLEDGEVLPPDMEEVTARGTVQKPLPEPLFVAGFATASLILPVADLVSAALDRSSSRFIEKEMLGSAPKGEKRIRLDQEIATEFEQLKGRLRFERAQSQGQAPAPVQANTGDMWGSLFGSETTAAATVASLIDLSQPEAVITKAFGDIRNYLERIYTEGGMGLEGAKYLVDQLLEHSAQHQAEIEAALTRVTRDQTAAQATADEPEPQPSTFETMSGIFTGLLGRRSSYDQRLEAHRNNRRVAQERIAQLGNELARDQQALEASQRLSTNLQAIRITLEGRISDLKGLVADLLRSRGLGGRDGAGGAPSISADEGVELFELATMVGWERYPVTGQGEASFLEAQVDPLVAAISSLDPAERERIVERVNDSKCQVCAISLQPNGSGGQNIVLNPVNPDLTNTLRTLLRRQLRDRAQRLGADHLGLRVASYLDWFYQAVEYDPDTDRSSHSPRYTPIDPLHMMHHRLRRIFLETDEVSLGSERSSDTEPMMVLGTDKDRNQDPGIRELLEDFDRWENVATATPDRIDASLSRHGFSIKALKNRRDLWEAYQYFVGTLEEKIHLHKDWDEDELGTLL